MPTYADMYKIFVNKLFDVNMVLNLHKPTIYKIRKNEHNFPKTFKEYYIGRYLIVMLPRLSFSFPFTKNNSTECRRGCNNIKFLSFEVEWCLRSFVRAQGAKQAASAYSKYVECRMADPEYKWQRMADLE